MILVRSSFNTNFSPFLLSGPTPIPVDGSVFDSDANFDFVPYCSINKENDKNLQGSIGREVKFDRGVHTMIQSRGPVADRGASQQNLLTASGERRGACARGRVE
ncbi:hypothetical protein EVAR_15691_1 [Eumeta japonica]|uniref:Uncharacterized protein n=1 Tax=Eumeta variegata TaxID=151549 RepID=A0A4C1UAC5_EUMVA|nr:hypothetical protein EVAR_15691_1 [Eumeta japonica]